MDVRFLLVLCLITMATANSSHQDASDSDAAHENVSDSDEDHGYPVTIGADNHVVQGRINTLVEVGTLIPSNVMVEGQEDADDKMHLRVEIRGSHYKRPHVYHPGIKINTTDPGNPTFEHPIISFDNNTLPYGMEFVVVHTNAFYVDENRYIVVNDFDSLNGETRIHFDVILKDKLAEVHYVSNHLPFVVELEYPARESNPNAALFAGVLIITIVAISLIIPFVVRAKRRSRAGKPICGCGSADDGSDSDSTESGADYPKTRSISIGGKDNLAMILDNNRLMHHRPSVDPHTTIQNAMLRSTSNMNFQPHYLDPHYNDVYDRPDYTYLTRPLAANAAALQNHIPYQNQALHHPSQVAYQNHLAYQQGHDIHNGLAFGKVPSSERSSVSSIGYMYPSNFNAPLIHGRPQSASLVQGLPQNGMFQFGSPQAGGPSTDSDDINREKPNSPIQMRQTASPDTIRVTVTSPADHEGLDSPEIQENGTTATESQMG